MSQDKKIAEIVKLLKKNSHLAGLKLEDIYKTEGDRWLMAAITVLDFTALTSLD